MTDSSPAFLGFIEKYIRSNEPLEPAATEFAKLYAQWIGASVERPEPRPPTSGSRLEFVKVVRTHPLLTNLTPQEAMRLHELISAAVAKLPSGANGAA